MLCLTRQNLPHLASSHAEKVSLGGYVCQDATDHDVILIGSGSEVSLCMGAAGNPSFLPSPPLFLPL